MYTWTIVTVTYNSERHLSEYWADFDSGRESIEWVVVDNGSADDSVALATRLGARVLDLGENIGFSAANNAGLAESSSQFVLFANPDLGVRCDDLSTLATYADELGGLVAPQLQTRPGLLQPNGRGVPYPWAKVSNRLAGRLAQARDAYRIYARPGELRHCAWLMGAAIAARREVFQTLGGWDAGYFLYYEDHDLGLRAWRNGYPVAVAGDVTWQHRWVRSTNTWSLNVTHAYEVASALRFYTTYPELLCGAKMTARRHPFLALGLRDGPSVAA